MKRPDLIPDQFIKIVYIEEGRIKGTVAFTYQCWHQSWKMFFTEEKPIKTHCDAQLVAKNQPRVEWEEVVAWDYINFEPFIHK